MESAPHRPIGDHSGQCIAAREGPPGEPGRSWSERVRRRLSERPGGRTTGLGYDQDGNELTGTGTSASRRELNGRTSTVRRTRPREPGGGRQATVFGSAARRGSTGRFAVRLGGVRTRGSPPTGWMPRPVTGTGRLRPRGPETRRASLR
ncbi:hypothetical protein CDG81_22955 [Actinopolyspora erythraea]|uniref:Uncharacterized protein n=1 Tax=Actinopolyspora erythraea TaxID=414996 RepID=A0A099DB65_9ACTN|nr:hypothetical protein CDG81_22955 [Actinopolyspora erythraea]KGI82982.1 hypothetical protein IL38_01865 [Actinopolyspora erythraea]